VARGIAGRASRVAWDGLKSGAGSIKDSIIENFSPTSFATKQKTSDSTTNPSDNYNEEQRETKKSDNGQHTESPNTKSKKETNPFSKDSIPKMKHL